MPRKPAIYSAIPLFSLGLLPVAVLLTALCVRADGPTVDSASQKPHYEIVMSEKDEICKPLAQLYNTMLDEFLVKKQPDPEEEDRCLRKTPDKDCYQGYFATNFEAEYPKRFEDIGFRVPPITTFSYTASLPPGSLGNPIQQASLYLIDLFDEGKPRMVRLYDRSYGMSISYTSVEILKKGLRKSEYHDDESDIDRDGGLRGLLDIQKRQGINLLHGSYFLTKWPGFEERYKAHLDGSSELTTHTKIEWPHAIAGKNSIRVFLHGGRPYFILNEYVNRFPPHRPDYTSTILVYQLTKTGADDVCYFHNGKGDPLQ